MSKTILYVDDEEDLRLVVSACLEDDGYQVLLAANAAEGLQTAFSSFPDLIITDGMMPDESGFSLCKKLKADPSTKDIPIIFLTVMDEEKTALEAGASAFLSKPFDDEELRQTVADLLKPSDGRAILEQALALLRTGQTDSGVKKLQEVIAADPDSGTGLWARYYVGQVQHQRSQHDDAIATFQSVLTQDGDFWRAHNRLGMIYETKNDLDRAAKHYERSLALNAGQDDIRKRLEHVKGKPL